MKFSFSDKLVKTKSFIELCNTVQYYAFDGVEISDVDAEISVHTDSIFRPSVTADAKRKLVNRHISIPAIVFPEIVDKNTDSTKIVKYVEYAALASVNGVVIKFEDLPAEDELKKVLTPAITVARHPLYA